MLATEARIRIVTVVASVVLAAAVGESLVRIFDITRPSEYRLVDRVLIVQRPHVGYRYEREGYSEGFYNRFGLRDRDVYSRRKPPGTYRILLFGDSMTEALQVDQELAYDNRLEDALGMRTGRAVEVLNFALSGTGTGDQLLRFEKQGLGFEPDFVLLAFYAGNDFRNNSLKCEGDPRRPYFVVTEDDGLTLDRGSGPGVWRRAATWLRQRSALFNGSYKTISYWLAAGPPPREKRVGPKETAFQTQRLLRELQSPRYGRSQLFLSQYPPLLQRCVEISFLLIEEFARTARAAGAGFAVLNIPFDLQVQDDMLDTEEIGRSDLDFAKPTAIVDSFLARTGIAAIPVLAPLRERYAATRQNPYGFGGALHGHLNPVGHEVVAAELERFFCSRHLDCRDGDRAAAHGTRNAPEASPSRN